MKEPVEQPRRPRLWLLRLTLTATLVTTNVSGVVVVYCLAALVVPLPQVPDDNVVRLQNLVLAAVYAGVALVFGIARGVRITRLALGWVPEGRRPTDLEKRAVMGLPGRIFAVQATLWLVGALFFGVYNALTVLVSLGALICVIVLLAGLSTSAIAYLLSERLVRPFARTALTSGVPERIGMRVGLRTFLAWLFGSGVIVLGIGLAGLTALLLDEGVTVRRLAVTMLVLGGLAFVHGGFTIWLATKAGSDPVRALRSSVTQVAGGNLDAEVPIYDGTELGVLQAGFNEMLAGLRERETIRDLFGRHVGDDVARAALEHGVQLGGEVREVAVLFVDIIGSTGLASRRPPEEVVGLLNRFFDVVIDVVDQHGGLVNKFEGDAALAIFGAPVELPDKERAVLAAARTMGARLRAEVPDLEAGIGVSAGPAVAGNVGASQRYEYTVIGDPVNEAARLTELAKSVPGLVVANARLLDRATGEASYWQELEPVVVRGRTEQTRIARPVDGGDRDGDVPHDPAGE
ncbi:MAG TPA: adenylate/guanylate cyclase domain-containing protein [Marmoricola sp.]|nr:adenylate/guanylate cyclase domain-containing protein [Marmoricola sp.]